LEERFTIAKMAWIGKHEIKEKEEADEVGKHLVISLMYVFRYAHFAICLNDPTRRQPSLKCNIF